MGIVFHLAFVSLCRAGGNKICLMTCCHERMENRSSLALSASMDFCCLTFAGVSFDVNKSSSGENKNFLFFPVVKSSIQALERRVTLEVMAHQQAAIQFPPLFILNQSFLC